MNSNQTTDALTKKWGKLTSDDIAAANGDRAVLTEKIQERYGIGKEEAQAEVDEFLGHHDHPEVSTEGAPVDMNTLKIGM